MFCLIRNILYTQLMFIIFFVSKNFVIAKILQCINVKDFS